MQFLTQLFGGMTQIWLNVAMLVCLFGVLIFKPQRIGNLTSFRAACLLFALSIIAPSIGMFLLTGESGMAGSRRGGSPFGEITLAMKIVYLLPPVLFAGSFLLAIGSLLPTARDTKEEAD